MAWLDTGCGTGTLARSALQQVKLSRLALSDPSSFMLEQAKAALADAELPVAFVDSPSQELFYHEEFQVVTAMLSHH